MRIDRTSLLLLVILAGALRVSCAEPLDSALTWLGAKDRGMLLDKRELGFVADKYDQLPLWKSSPFDRSVDKLFSGKPSTIAAEGLFLIDLPESAQLMGPDFVAHCMTAVSTLKGLQFYYEPYKAMVPFILDAYRVSKPDKKTRLPDLPFAGAPERGSFIMYQKEEQTGESYSVFEYFRTGDGIEVNQMNLTALNLGFIQLIAPRQMLTHIHVTQIGKQLLFYGIVEANTIQFFGLERAKAHSLYSRMKAIVSWFSGNLNALSAERS